MEFFVCFDHVAACQFYLSSTRVFKLQLFLVIYSKNNKTPQVVYLTNCERSERVILSQLTACWITGYHLCLHQIKFLQVHLIISILRWYREFAGKPRTSFSWWDPYMKYSPEMAPKDFQHQSTGQMKRKREAALLDHIWSQEVSDRKEKKIFNLFQICMINMLYLKSNWIALWWSSK